MFEDNFNTYFAKSAKAGIKKIKKILCGKQFQSFLTAASAVEAKK